MGPGRHVERRSHPHHLRPRQVRGGRIGALPEGEDVEAAIAGVQRVHFRADPVDEDVPGLDLVGLAVLPREPRAAEDEEDLLLVELGVGGSRPASGIDLDARDPDADAPRGLAEVAPAAAEVPLLQSLARDLVPVSDQSSSPSQ